MTKAIAVRIALECIVAVVAIAAGAGIVPTGPISAVVISRARRPNQHKMKVAAATSRDSRTKPG